MASKIGVLALPAGASATSSDSGASAKKPLLVISDTEWYKLPKRDLFPSELDKLQALVHISHYSVPRCWVNTYRRNDKRAAKQRVS